MPTDHDFMKIALEEAQAAYCRDEVPVGAVLVLEGNILARAHNSPIMRNDPTAHAEILALRHGALCYAGTMYYVRGRYYSGQDFARDFRGARSEMRCSGFLI
jgi:tRNA(Arg) A34 adenosine deaminase TadA